ncbi:hypothetical protein F5888DRAFT_1837689 [Russula emetica]|nr:hypothetical protein F5888DRAFT_1837689 [Russula emetica]
MSTRGRSASPQSRDVDVDMEKQSEDKLDAKVIVITNLTRNVVEAHLQSIFGFYGEVVKVDLPIYVKSGQNKGKAYLEYVDVASARTAMSHMNGGQLDGAALKVELSDVSLQRTRSRSPPPFRPRNGPRARAPPLIFPFPFPFTLATAASSSTQQAPTSRYIPSGRPHAFALSIPHPSRWYTWPEEEVSQL